MKPRLYLIAYDIADPGRLRRVHRYLTQRAVAVQYSLFALDAGATTIAEVRDGLAERIDPGKDDVRLYALPAHPDIITLGQAASLPQGVVLTGVAAPFLAPPRSERPSNA